MNSTVALAQSSVSMMQTRRIMHESSFSHPYDIKEARLIFFGMPAPAISGDQLVSRVERLAHINGDLTFLYADIHWLPITKEINSIAPTASCQAIEQSREITYHFRLGCPPI